MTVPPRGRPAAAGQGGDAGGRAARVVAGGRNVAGGVYGTILVIAVLGAWDAYPTAEALETLASLVATAAVFWIAHAYSHAIAQGVARQRTTWAEVRGALVLDWPIARAAMLPGIILGLSALGALGDRQALRLALAATVLSLFVFGLLMARAGARSWPRSLVVALVLSCLGLTIAVLEASLE